MLTMTGRPITLGVANSYVRNMMRLHGVYSYELANYLGITEQTLCRKLRYELPMQEQKELVTKVREVKKMNRGEKNGIADCC